MDSELRFLSALLYASPNDQQEFYLKSVPASLFQLREKEYEWVQRFRETHRKYPTIRTFSSHFNLQLKKPKDPLRSLLDEVYYRWVYGQIKKNVETVKSMFDSGSSAANIVRKYQDDANAIRAFTTSTVESHRARSNVVDRYYKERVRMRYESGASLIDSPWPTLNRLCGLFMPKESLVLVARTSMGKTWNALAWASYLAAKSIRVLVFSFEMDLTMIELRDEAIWMKLPFENLKNGLLLPAELRRWKDLKKKGRPYELYLSEPESEAGDNDISKMEEAVYRLQPQVVIADSFHLSKHPDFRANMPETQRLGILSAESKRFAKRNNVFFIPVIQIGRGAEDKKGRTKPSLTSVYGSDRWAQDNDYLLDISGQRGSDRRLHTLLKGRNSAVGEYRTFFSINPPDFSEKTIVGMPADDEKQIAEFTALK